MGVTKRSSGKKLSGTTNRETPPPVRAVHAAGKTESEGEGHRGRPLTERTHRPRPCAAGAGGTAQTRPSKPDQCFSPVIILKQLITYLFWDWSFSHCWGSCPGTGTCNENVSFEPLHCNICISNIKILYSSQPWNIQPYFQSQNSGSICVCLSLFRHEFIFQQNYVFTLQIPLIFFRVKNYLLFKI